MAYQILCVSLYCEVFIENGERILVQMVWVIDRLCGYGYVTNQQPHVGKMCV